MRLRGIGFLFRPAAVPVHLHRYGNGRFAAFAVEQIVFSVSPGDKMLIRPREGLVIMAANPVSGFVDQTERAVAGTVSLSNFPLCAAGLDNKHAVCALRRPNRGAAGTAVNIVTNDIHIPVGNGILRHISLRSFGHIGISHGLPHNFGKNKQAAAVRRQPGISGGQLDLRQRTGIVGKPAARRVIIPLAEQQFAIGVASIESYSRGTTILPVCGSNTPHL